MEDLSIWLKMAVGDPCAISQAPEPNPTRRQDDAPRQGDTSRTPRSMSSSGKTQLPNNCTTVLPIRMLYFITVSILPKISRFLFFPFLLQNGMLSSKCSTQTGDYVSYMTPTTKDTRRSDWKAMNFAGSIDWALDLQAFTSDDMKAAPDRGDTGSEGCVSGRDLTVNSGDLCEHSCAWGSCPESLCLCTETGPLRELPAVVADTEYIAWDEFDVDLNRLCKFSCKYGICPRETCTVPVVDEDEEAASGGGIGDTYEQASSYYSDARLANQWNCQIFQDPAKRDISINQCRPVCAPAMKEAEAEGRTTNLGCVGLYPLDKEIPWQKEPGGREIYAPARCSCDNYLVNFLADTVIEAMPIIAQVPRPPFLLFFPVSPLLSI